MYLDLLKQAQSLIRLDARGAPRQVNLRRSVSTAYYALFHFLVDQACRPIVGTQHNQQGFRYAIARAFVHTTMKSACNSFSGTQLPDAVLKSLPKNHDGKYPIPEAIKQISTLFKELQQKRHLADYDLSERFKRSEVLLLVQQVEQQIEAFSALPISDDRQFFLIFLLAWKDLANR